MPRPIYAIVKTDEIYNMAMTLKLTLSREKNVSETDLSCLNHFLFAFGTNKHIKIQYFTEKTEIYILVYVQRWHQTAIFGN